VTATIGSALEPHANAVNRSEWDRFASGHAGFTHCHLSGWRDVIEKVFDHECLQFQERDAGGRLAGVLPLVRVKSALFGHYLVSMPFLNYGGPLGTEVACRALASRAAEEARQSNADIMELRSRVTLPVDLPDSHRKITALLDLPNDAEVLMKTLSAKVRSQIRRPRKEGVTVRFGADQVDPFYRVFSRHMRDLGTPTFPRKYFEVIAETFPESAWFGCAWRGAEPIAGGAGFATDGEFEMAWASALLAYKQIAANMLLYWAFMERAIETRIPVFNFGRCTPGSGSHRFKKQWGSRDVQLHWYQYSRSGSPDTTPFTSDRQYVWGPRIWRCLPVPVATLLGPRFVRYVP
jgi:FemAB-related protein (PEP-CTERM system-associated)